MAWRSGTFSRSFLNAARSPSIRRSTTAFRRPTSPLIPTPLRHSRRLSFTNPRIIGCVQSLMAEHSVMADARLTSHVAVEARACCELSQGTFCRTCPDR